MKRFMILAKMIPEAVVMENATEPRRNISSDLKVRKTSAWLLAPTVNTGKMAAVSITEVLAVFAGRLISRAILL